jgi:hypothetical protein
MAHLFISPAQVQSNHQRKMAHLAVNKFACEGAIKSSAKDGTFSSEYWLV